MKTSVRADRYKMPKAGVRGGAGLGHMVNRTRKEFSDKDFARTACTHCVWRGSPDAVPYRDEPGFCESPVLEVIERHDHVLAPGCHFGAAPQMDDGALFEDKTKRLSAEPREQRAEGAMLDAEIAKNLEPRGFGLQHK